MFTKLNEFDIQGYNLVMKYNDAEYAKLSMAPLWAEIMDRINPLVNDETVDQFGRIIPKLALFSGHDTTIMPLLATLGPDLWGDKDWAPYASMVLIEVSTRLYFCISTRLYFWGKANNSFTLSPPN